MHRSLALLLVFLFSPALEAAEEPASRVDYERDVKPILQSRCYACHGPLRQRSGLRLDTAELMRRGSDAGPVITPGDSEGSLLILALTGELGFRMPPEGEPLEAEQIERLRSWIDQGAQAPPEEPAEDPRTHWAFQPPRRPAVPVVKHTSRVQNPLDAFLAAEHEKRGLVPVPEAERHVLLRRLYLDLVGLPPSREALQQYLADTAPGAYERVVDKLLASPRYGERWGRHWMDVWRYSDWSGYRDEIRNSQRHIWHWRDWIIESLNRDKGYDRMVLEMLAGDELAPTDPETLRATGFLARNWYKFNRNVWLERTIEHTAKGLLGLTFHCARCHDHKYDPIANEEYYRFRAFFEPHQVRTDRLPGRPDLIEAGLPRVFDGDLEAVTYVFARGDERNPIKDKTLSPALPGFLGGELAIEPVNLPAQAYYAGLKSFVRREEVAAAEAAAGNAVATLEDARRTLGEAQERRAALSESVVQAGKPVSAKVPADALTFLNNVRSAALDAEKKLVETAEGAVALAEKKRRVAEAQLQAVCARIDADAAKFADQPMQNAEDLARKAAKAQRQAAVAKAEANVLSAEQKLASAQQGSDAATEAGEKAIADAEKEVSSAREALAKAEAALSESTSDYTPLTDVHPAMSTGRRLALARWMARRDNPLTSRVAVNHIWLRHFGTPLVPTVFDFGLRGSKPTHPALLDWLAVEFVESGWSMKSLHRLIVTSHAYRRQSSAPVDSPNRRIDAENRYLWRMNPRRMEAEIVRDSVLEVAGALDETMGGPEVRYESGLRSHRRSVYFQHAYEKQMTFLKLFDVASVNECYRRKPSVIPQQALALANSTLTLEQARLLARRLSEANGPASNRGTDPSFVAAAFEQVLGRPETDGERAVCLQFLSRQARRLQNPEKLTAFDGGDDCEVKPASNPDQRARENLVHVLMNHNDFVTIR